MVLEKRVKKFLYISFGLILIYCDSGGILLLNHQEHKIINYEKTNITFELSYLADDFELFVGVESSDHVLIRLDTMQIIYKQKKLQYEIRHIDGKLNNHSSVYELSSASKYFLYSFEFSQDIIAGNGKISICATDYININGNNYGIDTLTFYYIDQ